MQCSELVRGVGFRGAPVAFSSAVSIRLGRALATWLRRRGSSARHVLVARSGNGLEADVRDGLVSGLVLAGVSVIDAGCVSHERFVAALESATWPLLGGLSLGSTDDAITLGVFEGVGAVSGAPLVEIAALADRGAFAAADTGGVVMLDTTSLPWPTRGRIPSDADAADISAADHTLADE